MSLSYDTTYDVLVIGGGVVGCAVLRELSRYDLRIALIEAEGDVGQGISRANTAIAHTGFDAVPGTLEARLVTHSHRGFAALCAELGVAIRPCGALMVALAEDDLLRLDDYEHKAALNGIPVERIGRETLFARWPFLNRIALGGLFIPGEMPIDSFGLTLAYAEAAVRNGATIIFDQPVVSITQATDALIVATARHQFQARFVVNAAGLKAAHIAGMVGDHSFDIRPRKGQLLVVEPHDTLPIETILLPTPSPTTKGILITPAAHGNLLLGPTAEDSTNLDDWQTTSAGVEQILQGVRRLVPNLAVERPLTQYAGIRSVGYEWVDQSYIPASDYIVRPATTCPRLIHVAGIRSTGLSASPALATYVVELLAAHGLVLEPSPSPLHPQAEACGNGTIDHGTIDHSRRLQPAELGANQNQIVCQCAGVTAGQVRDAIHGAVPARTLDALKRRLWTMAGPCQGSLCIASLVQILADQLGCDPTDVRKHAIGSEVLVGMQVVGAVGAYSYTRPPLTNHLANHYQVAVIGGGPAGLAAAHAAQQASATVLLVDLADRPGGALAAMGLLDAQPRYRAAVAEQQPTILPWQPGEWPVAGIDTIFRTALTQIEGDTLMLHGPQGAQRIQADMLVLATGGRETTRGNLAIPGSRPAGVLTAGAALRLIATTGHLPGKRAVVAGTGRWAGNVAEWLAAVGVQVGVITPKVLQIEGWPRLTHVVLASGGRSACDLLVIANDVQPWESLSMRGARIQIFFAGSMVLGECTAAEAADDGFSVGMRVAQIVLGS